MNRHYYVSNDLDELETVEHELEAKGIRLEQMHVLSQNDADVEAHRLNEVTSFMKRDLVRSSEIGALVGAFVAAFVLIGAWLMDWTQTTAGWLPFIFLAVIMFGICTWEGGFFGFQEPNAHFRRFKKLLKHGKHIFFVDVEPNQEAALSRVVRQHPHLKTAGYGYGSPNWVVACQRKWHAFKRTI